MTLLQSRIARSCVIASLATQFSGSIAEAADPLLSYKSEIIAKAQPDECFWGINPNEGLETPTTPENEYRKILGGIDCEDCINRGGAPKTNQSYVWGMTRKDNYLWFGTGPNVNRLVGSAYLGASNSTISTNNAGVTFSAVEYGESRFAREGAIDLEESDPLEATKLETVDPIFGDWRPPDIFCYDLDTDTLTRKDIEIKEAGDNGHGWSLLWRTIGLRSAGYSAPSGAHSEGLIFLAGPNLDPSNGTARGVSMFAFDAASKAYVGAQDFPTYTNIRKWKFYNDQLYTAIATDTGSGEVLRWINDPSNPDWPFAFEVVGELDAGGAELEIHDDGEGARLYVNTWPGIEGNLDLEGDPTAVQGLINAPAGLWRSPIIPAGGLNNSHKNNWGLVWSVTDYEPDLVVGLHYGGGAMASFDGYLWWGTMHVPVTSSLAHSIAYGGPSPIIPRPDPYPTDPEDPDRVAYEADVQRYRDESLLDFYNSYRAISIWRGRNFTSTGGEIDLVYGNEEMPVRLERSVFTANNEPRGDFNIGWASFFASNLGQLRSVEDGATVTYLWGGFWPTSVTLEDGGDWDTQPNVSGYVPLHGPEGIMPDDFVYTSFAFNNYTWTMQVFEDKLYIGTMDWDDISTPDPADGAHLYVIPSANEPAIPVTRRGMANWSSYGIRTIAADDSRGELYLGMANVNNLLSTKVGDPVDGGWEIQRVTLRYPDEDFDELDDDWETSQFGNTTSVNSPTGNSDNDPLNDYDEWLAGTNPNNPGSFFFAAVDESESEGMQQIEWASIANRYYTVYETDDLSGTWSAVATYSGTGNTLAHEYDPSLSTAKFFKVLITLDAPSP